VNTTALRAYNAMDKIGVAKVIGHFSGGNDEGGYDEISFLDAEGNEVAVPGASDRSYFSVYDEMSQHEWGGGGWRKTSIKEGPAAAIADHLYEVIDGAYGSFAGEFSVYGDVIVDVKAHKTSIVGEEQSGYDHFERYV
jgi:hypothetical protein